MARSKYGKNPDVCAVVSELADNDVHDYEISCRKGHITITWAGGMCRVSGTPSDRRSALNARANARRQLRGEK